MTSAPAPGPSSTARTAASSAGVTPTTRRCEYSLELTGPGSPHCPPSSHHCPHVLQTTISFQLRTKCALVTLQGVWKLLSTLLSSILCSLIQVLFYSLLSGLGVTPGLVSVSVSRATRGLTVTGPAPSTPTGPGVPR